MDPKPTVLIVDDHPANLIGLKAILDTLEINIVSANSGKEALALLLQYDFALVLLDVQMPDMDGFEVAELMRKSKKTRKIPIIFITAISTDEGHIFRGYESGAVDYICKPIIEPKILINKVKIFCDLHLAKRKTEESLRIVRKSMAQWQLTFDAIDDLVTIHDTNHHILRVNKATCDFFQLSPEEMIGQRCYNFFCPEKTKCDKCQAAIVEQTLQTHTTEISYENTLGKTFQVTISPIIDENQEFIGIVHIVKDISAQKHLESQLRQAQKMEAIGTLAGGIAHDFNNILTPIVGYANLLRLQVEPDSQLHKGLSTILYAAKRATELVKQILAFSRRHEQEMAPLSIQPIVKEVLKLLRSTLPTNIDIQHKIDMDCGVILADPTQIHQLLMNLCTNSSHAMSNDGGILKVSVQCLDLTSKECAKFHLLSTGSHISLEVADTGCGMTPELMNRIFEPYFTTKEMEKGTGMGLAVVHNIVTNHSGDIRVRSEPGEGTTFTILLPVIQREEEDHIQNIVQPLQKGTEHILLVDDEQSVITVHREMLVSLGYTVSTASNSNEALELFRKDPTKFDLLFTDMTMPGLSGKDLARKILILRPDIPIIICSGYSEQLDTEQAKDLGIQKYLCKPVSLNKMAFAIREVLQ